MSDGGANSGQLQSFTIDQFAGALALCLGAVGSLLLVVWQSRCLCRCRIGLSDQCYIFDCSREPPLAETEAGAEDKDNPPKTTAKKEAENDIEAVPGPEPEPEPEPEMLIPQQNQP